MARRHAYTVPMYTGREYKERWKMFAAGENLLGRQGRVNSSILNVHFGVRHNAIDEATFL